MRVYSFDALPHQLIEPTYSTATGGTITASKIEVGRYSFAPDTGAAAHQHPNEQIMVVIQGKVRARSGGQEAILGPFEGWVMPSNTMHQITAYGGNEAVVISGKDLLGGNEQASGAGAPARIFHAASLGETVEGIKIGMRRCKYQKGNGSQPHQHPEEKIICVVAGRIRVKTRDEEIELGPSGAAWIPRETVHSIIALEETFFLSFKDIVSHSHSSNSYGEVDD